MGVDNLATAIGEERDVIEDVYEPFLIQKGFLQRTRQGRIISCAGAPPEPADWLQAEALPEVVVLGQGSVLRLLGVTLLGCAGEPPLSASTSACVVRRAGEADELGAAQRPTGHKERPPRYSPWGRSMKWPRWAKSQGGPMA